MLLLPLGNTFKCHEDVLSLQPMIPPTKRFDIFSPCVGCSEGLDAFRFFFKKKKKGRSHLLGVSTFFHLSVGDAQKA